MWGWAGCCRLRPGILPTSRPVAWHHLQVWAQLLYALGSHRSQSCHPLPQSSGTPSVGHVACPGSRCPRGQSGREWSSLSGNQGCSVLSRQRSQTQDRFSGLSWRASPRAPQQVPTALLSVVPSDKLREAARACPRSHSKARVPYVGGAPSLPGSFKPQHPTITPQVLPAPDWPGRTQGSPQKVMVLSREKALYLPTWAVCPSFFP